jgi:hypothetical protein
MRAETYRISLLGKNRDAVFGQFKDVQWQGTGGMKFCTITTGKYSKITIWNNATQESSPRMVTPDFYKGTDLLILCPKDSDELQSLYAKLKNDAKTPRVAVLWGAQEITHREIQVLKVKNGQTLENLVEAAIDLASMPRNGDLKIEDMKPPKNECAVM